MCVLFVVETNFACHDSCVLANLKPFECGISSYRILRFITGAMKVAGTTGESIRKQLREVGVRATFPTRWLMSGYVL